MLIARISSGGNGVVMNHREYSKINMEKTGILLREKVAEKGYTVKDIQNYLQLSCPQPVYRWFKGKVMPSVDHLLMLSKVLKVHMEDLLVVEEDIEGWDREIDDGKVEYYDIQGQKGIGEKEKFPGTVERLWIYWGKLNTGAA